MAGNADVAIQEDVGGQVYYLSFNQKNENYKNAKFLDAMRCAGRLIIRAWPTPS